jgi:hypothetical protein
MPGYEPPINIHGAPAGVKLILDRFPDLLKLHAKLGKSASACSVVRNSKSEAGLFDETLIGDDSP